MTSRLNVITEQSTECPCCGESISLLVDTSVPQQEYIEDCQVCCRPMRVSIDIDAHGDVTLNVADENESA